MEKKEYTNEMIDKLMSVMVPTFCYRGEDVTPCTSRVGFAELDDFTYEVWSEEDNGPGFHVDDVHADDNSDLRADLIDLFDRLIDFARKEYGLKVVKMDLEDYGSASIYFE